MTTQANPNVDTTYVEEQEAMLAQVLLLSYYIIIINDGFPGRETPRSNNGKPVHRAAS